MSIILIILLFFGIHDISYKDLFSGDYEKAQEFIFENEVLINEVSQMFGTDPKIISSIVFPEAIRYSMIRDYLETTSLELVYVSTGTADFSIGSFQIKPSFAQRIEYYVENEMDYVDSDLKSWFKYGDGLKDYQIRRERLERLKSTDCQLYYINIFYKFILQKFSYLNSSDREYLIKFLSTAYNHNFESDRAEIEAYMDKSFFPWGVNNEKEKFNYSDIAWYYFQHSK